MAEGGLGEPGHTKPFREYTEEKQLSGQSRSWQEGAVPFLKGD